MENKVEKMVETLERPGWMWRYLTNNVERPRTDGKSPTFDELQSMMLLEESDMSTQSVSSSLLHASSSSPTVLVASTKQHDKANTISTSGFDMCRNFQRGSCSYRARCPTNPYGPAQLGSTTPLAQQGLPGLTPYTVAPQFQQPGSMMFPNYDMSSSYLPHATMLP
ncbi:hypothetical protein Tco_1448312 [Tanacetum coccineum]